MMTTVSIDKGSMQKPQRGFDTANYEELSKEVRGLVYQLIKRFHPNRNQPIEDIAWDCFTTLWMRGFFHKYDLTLSKETTYLWNGVKNYLIDMERVVGTKAKTISIDEEIRGTNILLSETLDSKVSDVAVGLEAYLEMIAVLKRDRSVRMDSRVQESYTKELGKTELSVYSVMYLSLCGYKNYEIAEMFGVTPCYISQIWNRGAERLRSRLGLDLPSNEQQKEQVELEQPALAVCRHCESEKTTFLDYYWSGVPFYRCDDCGRQFNEFTNTPLQYMRTKERIDFLEFCINHKEGNHVLKTAGIANTDKHKIDKFVSVYNSVSEDKGDLAIGYFRKWRHVVLTSEERRLSWRNKR